MKIFITLFLSTLSLQPVFAAEKLTRAQLLKGCPIPDERAFPLSKEIKPCDDFHAYVCSEVEKSFKLPEDRSYWNFAFVDNSERLLYAKKTYFQRLEDGAEPLSDRAKPIKNYFLACMSEKATAQEEKNKVAKEKAVLKPLASWKELIELSGSRMDQPDYKFIDFDQIANQKDTNRYDALFMSKIMTLPERSYYERKDLLVDYQKLLILFFKTIELDEPEKRADWVIAFEKEIASRYPLPRDFRQRLSTDTYITRANLLKKYPKLALTSILKRIPEKTPIRNLTPETLDWLNTSLETLPIEQLKSVFLFHALSHDMDDA